MVLFPDSPAPAIEIWECYQLIYQVFIDVKTCDSFLWVNLLQITSYVKKESNQSGLERYYWLSTFEDSSNPSILILESDIVLAPR